MIQKLLTLWILVKAWLNSWTSFCLFGIGVRTVKGWMKEATLFFMPGSQYNYFVRVPEMLGVPRAHVPRFCLCVPRSRVPILNLFSSRSKFWVPAFQIL